MNDADLVVEAFDKAKGNFISWLRVGGNAVPMFFNQLGKLLIEFKTLPA